MEHLGGKGSPRTSSGTSFGCVPSGRSLTTQLHMICARPVQSCATRGPRNRTDSGPPGTRVRAHYGAISRLQAESWKASKRPVWALVRGSNGRIKVSPVRASQAVQDEHSAISRAWRDSANRADLKRTAQRSQTPGHGEVSYRSCVAVGRLRITAEGSAGEMRSISLGGSLLLGSLPISLRSAANRGRSPHGKRRSAPEAGRRRQDFFADRRSFSRASPVH